MKSLEFHFHYICLLHVFFMFWESTVTVLPCQLGWGCRTGCELVNMCDKQHRTPSRPPSCCWSLWSQYSATKHTWWRRDITSKKGIFVAHPDSLLIVTDCDEFLLSNLVPLGTTLAPTQQGVSSGAAMTPQQSAETILRSGKARTRLTTVLIMTYCSFLNIVTKGLNKEH